MGNINYNERSWAIDVITEINRWSSTKDVLIKRAGGENTLKESKEIYFPDVLLYGDASSGVIIQGWELKMPDTKIDNKELIQNAHRKAEILKLNSFLVWNVSTAVLYKIVDKNLEIVHTWNDLSDIKTREDVFSSKNRWKCMLDKILEDLNYYFQKGEIQTSSVIDSITGDGISNMILNHTQAVAESIKKRIQKDGELDDNITIWWLSAKNEYITDNEPYTPLARLSLISWMNKLLFANLLKKYQKEAQIIDNIIGDITVGDAIKIINEISLKCDFRNIFKENLGENCIPQITWNNIKAFNKFLVETRLDDVEQDIMKKILTNVVKKASRRVSGQFSTPDSLAMFLSKLVILDKTKNTLDPCCGTGTIPKVCYDIKVQSGVDGKEALATTWASDKFTFPLQFAMLSMTHPEHIGEVVKIFNEDATNLEKDKIIHLYSPKDGSKIDTKLPNIGYILSNLPFVQQETIKHLNNGVKEKINSKIKLLTNDNTLELHGKSDLYSYIPFALWDVLDENGKIGLIVSNSWLGAEWGNSFYKCIQYFFDVEMIVTSGDGRWFKNAQVVTNILVLKKRSKVDTKNKSSKTSYITLNKDIYSDNFIDNINNICTHIRKNLILDDFNKVTYSKDEEENILDMGLSKNALFSDVAWIIDVKDKLIKANNLFNIARGERRGWDAMFYPQDGHGIDNDYIEKVIKSSREIEGYIAKPESIAFCCEKTIEELKILNHKGTINWINKFENEVNGKNKPLTKVLARPNTFWYTMKANTMADICITMNPGDRLFFSRLEKPAFVNQRLIRLVKKNEDINVKLCSALLNSILGLFYIEALGFGRGLGALDLSATNLKNKLYMLNPNKINKINKLEIINKYEKLESREVLKLDKELIQSDRKDFDITVLTAFGIEDYYDKIHKSLTNLYKIRKAALK